MSILKTSYTRRNNIKYLKPLYILANIVFVAPPNNFDEIKTPQNELYKTLVLLNGLFVTFCFFVSVFGQGRNFLGLHPAVKLCETTYFGLVTGVHLVSSLKSAFAFNKKWHEFIRKFVLLDVKFKIEPKKGGVWFATEITIAHISLFLLLSYDGYVNIESFGFPIYTWLIFGRLQYYFLMVKALLVCNFALSLKHRFSHYNEILLETFGHKRTKHGLGKWGRCLTLGNGKGTATAFTKTFVEMAELVKLLNKLFGWFILFLLGIALISLLNSVNIVIILGATHQVPGRSEFGNVVLVLPFLFTSILLVWTVLVIACCDIANKEIQKTSLVCYQILTESQISVEEGGQLLILAEQATLTCPQISAASVFDVSISNLFSLLGLLVSLIIVFVPFDK